MKITPPPPPPSPHLVPQVVVLLSILQGGGPVLLPLLHLPVEDDHGARQPPAGSGPPQPCPGPPQPRPGPPQPRPGAPRRTDRSPPQPLQDSEASSAPHVFVLSDSSSFLKKDGAETRTRICLGLWEIAEPDQNLVRDSAISAEFRCQPGPWR